MVNLDISFGTDEELWTLRKQRDNQNPASVWQKLSEVCLTHFSDMNNGIQGNVCYCTWLCSFKKHMYIFILTQTLSYDRICLMIS